ncbi:hypothetical protein Tco_1292166 [Tanacetum coccineum]
MSTIDKSSTSIKDLYQGLNVITQHLKDINTAVKDDPATNKKIDEAIETFAKISTNTTEVLSLVKGFDFSTLQSTMKDLQAHALKQREESYAWAKSSTKMAWNLGSRMTAIEISQTAFKGEVSSLRHDTSDIKSMMTEIYQAFKGQSSLAPSSSVTLTLSLTNIRANVEGGNATNTATEEPPSHTEGETEDPKMAIPISSIQPTEVPQTQAQPITTITTHSKVFSSISRMINGQKKKGCNWSAEEPSKKPTEVEKKNSKWVQEEAEKIGLDPNKIACSKVGEKFKKAQDAEHQVLKREHSQKVKRLTELNKKRAKQYMNNDKINFDGHNPFKFTDFGITELDELSPIIQKKKNSIVKYLMTYLSKRYERLKKIHEELGIQYALSVPSLNKPHPKPQEEKGSMWNWNPRSRCLGWNNDIHKVRVDYLVLYLVMASMVKTEENARFSLKLRKLIADHPDQEKVKSKRVKLEALGYQID